MTYAVFMLTLVAGTVSVHRSLAANTRRHLQALVELEPDELTSLLRLVRTEATRMLATIPPGGDD